MNRRSFCLLLGPLALSACASVPPDEATGATEAQLNVPTLPLARASLLAADAAAANATTLRGIDGFLGSLSDDALLLLRTQPLLVGKPAIAAFFAQHPLSGNLGWRYARGDVSALGDFGYTLGWSEVLDPPDASGNVAAHYSIYAAAWKRHFDQWKMRAFVQLDLTGPPAPPPAGFLPITTDGPVFPAARTPDKLQRELLDTDTAFAALTQQVGQQLGFDAYAADDAIEMDDPFLFGRKAIFDSKAGIPATTNLNWQPLYADGSQSADLGLTVGSYVVHAVGGDGSPITRFGKYLTIWRRGADRRFKWVVDGGNSSPPPSPPP